jgi:hypothetical protein
MIHEKVFTEMKKKRRLDKIFKFDKKISYNEMNAIIKRVKMWDIKEAVMSQREV